MFHSLPFVFAFVIVSLDYYQHYHSSYLLTTNAWLILILGYYTQAIIYTLFALVLLHKYHKEIKTLFSSLEKVKLSWLAFLLSGFLLIWITFLSEFLLNVNGISSPELSNLLLSFGLILLFIFANTIVYKCLKAPQLFGVLDEKNKIPQLPKAVNDETAKKLSEFMAQEKPYLSPNISLSDLSEKLSIHPRTLSLTIKYSYKQNFFDFINSYRIKEAQRLLSNNNGKKTILEILWDSGFNSKSVFNRAFKKHTGITPSQYKKMHNS